MQNPTEKFYEVDAQDNPIGPISREEANSSSERYHRAMNLFLFDQGGNLLVSKRKQSKDSFPGKFDLSVTGHVNYPEEYVDAALRETEEEVGVELRRDQLRMLGVQLVEMESENEFQQNFLAILDENQKKSLKTLEAESLEFMGFDEVVKDIDQNPGDWTDWAREAVGNFSSDLKNFQKLLPYLVNFSPNYDRLFSALESLYHQEENKAKLLFHGWHHVKFVHDKAIEFAQDLGANLEITAISALLHDLNYIFTEKLEPEEANQQISKYLSEVGYNGEFSSSVLDAIESAHTGYREKRELSLEAKALSDADSLFKVLPTTPILFSSNFIKQNNFDIFKLARKVTEEQQPLLGGGDYFYSQLAREKYLEWAQTNLELWEHVSSATSDDGVKEMLSRAARMGVI